MTETGDPAPARDGDPIDRRLWLAASLSAVAAFAVGGLKVSAETARVDAVDLGGGYYLVAGWVLTQADLDALKLDAGR